MRAQQRLVFDVLSGWKGEGRGAFFFFFMPALSVCSPIIRHPDGGLSSALPSAPAKCVGVSFRRVFTPFVYAIEPLRTFF